jgi:hypothetical protein
MTDALPKEFDSLDYPGRRKPKNRDVEPVAPDTELWDAKPVYYLINGEKREFFTISHVAKALDYSVQSIRAWEAQGLLPRTPFRSPRTARPVAGGRSDKGKRLWTRDQIMGIVRTAKKHGVIFPDRKGHKKPPTPGFSAEVADLFHSLLQN